MGTPCRAWSTSSGEPIETLKRILAKSFLSRLEVKRFHESGSDSAGIENLTDLLEATFEVLEQLVVSDRATCGFSVSLVFDCFNPRSVT